VLQDQPNDVITAPSREVPMVGRASTIRFGPVGTGFDRARLAWPSEERVSSSQAADLSALLPNRPKVPEVGSPGRLGVGFLQRENHVDVLLIASSLDHTSWTRSVERTPVNATSAATLFKVAKRAQAKVLRKHMRALGYEVTYWSNGSPLAQALRPSSQRFCDITPGVSIMWAQLQHSLQSTPKGETVTYGVARRLRSAASACYQNDLAAVYPHQATLEQRRVRRTMMRGQRRGSYSERSPDRPWCDQISNDLDPLC
jgi:hypothetical protein